MRSASILKGLAIMLIALLGIACKESGGKVYVIKVSLSQNRQEPQVRAVELFKQVVESRSEGRMKVEIYPNNQLGNQRDVAEESSWQRSR